MKTSGLTKYKRAVNVKLRRYVGLSIKDIPYDYAKEYYADTSPAICAIHAVCWAGEQQVKNRLRKGIKHGNAILGN